MFYFLYVVIVLYNLVLYANFRSGIYDYLRLCEMSKSNIRKNRKGFINYWLYQSIHQIHPLGFLYYLNCLYLIFTCAFTILVLALGFINMLQPVFFILSVILCMIEIPATVLASIYDCKQQYQKPFVLFRRTTKRGYYYSSLFDMFSWCITALLICFAYQQR